MYYILVVDDEPSVQRELRSLLENAGYRADIVEDFTCIPEYVQKVRPDLILLDVALPGADGITLCSKIRMMSDVPIIFITSQSSSSAELECMMTGGDDFIEKPYRPAVLLAHIAAVLRRVSGRSQNKVLVFHGIVLDLLDGTIQYEKKKVELSKNELHILSYFFTHKGEIVSREDLMNALWDNESFVDDNTLSVNIRRIRRKLEDIGIKDLIQTKRGMGYRLKMREREDEAEGSL